MGGEEQVMTEWKGGKFIKVGDDIKCIRYMDPYANLWDNPRPDMIAVMTITIAKDKSVTIATRGVSVEHTTIDRVTISGFASKAVSTLDELDNYKKAYASTSDEVSDICAEALGIYPMFKDCPEIGGKPEDKGYFTGERS